MQRIGSKRVCFSPDINEEPTIHLRSSFITAKAKITPWPRNYRKIPGRGIIRLVKTGVARAIRLITSSKRQTSSKASSNMVVPQQFIPPRESHHSEAFEDCMEFINSSYRKSSDTSLFDSI